MKNDPQESVESRPASRDGALEGAGNQAFREALRAELPLWRERGWVTEEGARALNENYRLSEVRADTGRLVSLAIFGMPALP